MKISHVVGLYGIGGVQSNFIEYISNIESNPSKYDHRVYTIGKVDAHYQLSRVVLDIRKFSNLYRLILDIVSKDVIVHFYNNLSSLKVALLLSVLPTYNIVVHERGTVWNQKRSRWIVTRFIAWKSTIILSNSYATKTMLSKKFSISSKKINVLYNGVNTATNYNCSIDKSNDSIFRIGFIGRLDSPKGVHVLIKAMRYLKNENIKLTIAGEGVLGDILKESASDLNNVEFIGRVSCPFAVLDKINLLVVPSIREPLGNVCLEAALCKTPVLAANVDGIPEIIEHKITGELISATDEISIDFPENAVLLPEFVVNSVSQQLCSPKQINPYILAKRVLELSTEPDRLSYYANNLYDKVVCDFSISKYRDKLHSIYDNLHNL